MIVFDEKDAVRAQLARDIKAYLARGKVIKTYVRDESAIGGRKNKATWEKKARGVPKKASVSTKPKKEK